MQPHLNKIKNYILTHKKTSIFFLIVILLVGYFSYQKATSTTGDTRYVVSKVQKGTIVSAVTGTGQVSVLSSIDLKPKASGTVNSILVKAGEGVTQGQTLVSLDVSDAMKKLRDTELDLQTAKLSLADAKRDYDTTKLSLDDSLKNKLIALNSSTVAVPNDNNISTNIISLTGSYTSVAQGQYHISLYNCASTLCYQYTGLEKGSSSITLNLAKPLGVNGLFITFNSLPKSGDEWTIDIPSTASSSYNANLDAYNQAKIDNTSTLAAKQSMIDNQNLMVTQKENAVSDAKDALADYSVFAPFAGTISSVPVQLGESASTSTVLASIVTTKQLAEISLNEVDVAKIKLGQKATLTFDAVPDLSLTGAVSEIDTVGTVSSGVVTYNVKISFDTQDDRIKPGMSVSAAIITGVKQNVLMVPNSAIKSSNSGSYVEMFDTPLLKPTDGLPGSISKIAPNKIPVEVGLSNDTQTEITSGIKEGDEIVTRTILPTAAKTTAPSIFGGAGGARVGGGARVN